MASATIAVAGSQEEEAAWYVTSDLEVSAWNHGQCSRLGWNCRCMA